MKDSRPLQLAGYAMLFERNRIIEKVVLKYWLQTRKFVIKMTKVSQALLSNIENGGVLSSQLCSRAFKSILQSCS
jgi:hypothetical protein